MRGDQVLRCYRRPENSGGEGRGIASPRNLEPQSFLFALCREVLIDPLTQIPCIAANYIVVIRVVAFGPAEDQDPDLLFCDFIGAIADMTIDDIQQEFCEQTRTPQAATCSDASRKLPPGILHMGMMFDSTCLRRRRSDPRSDLR